MPGVSFKNAIDRCIAVAQQELLHMIDLYLIHGLVDDRNAVLGQPLPGPFTDFTIVDLEDWCFVGPEGEECVRIWFTTSN